MKKSSRAIANKTKPPQKPTSVASLLNNFKDQLGNKQSGSSLLTKQRMQMMNYGN